MKRKFMINVIVEIEEAGESPDPAIASKLVSQALGNYKRDLASDESRWQFGEISVSGAMTIGGK